IGDPHEGRRLAKGETRASAPQSSPAIFLSASSYTPAGCPPEIGRFPSTTTAGAALIPRLFSLPLEGEGAGDGVVARCVRTWRGRRRRPSASRLAHPATTPSQPSPLEGEGFRARSLIQFHP